MSPSKTALGIAGLVGCLFSARIEGKEKGGPAIQVRDSTPIVRLIRAGAVQAELGLSRKQRTAVETLAAEVDYPQIGRAHV